MNRRPQPTQQQEKAIEQTPGPDKVIAEVTLKRSWLKRAVLWLKRIVRTNDLQQENGI